MIMELTQEARNKVAEWVEEGRSLSDIQKSLMNELEISMTYMDVRFLVDDLGLEIGKEEETQEESVPTEEPEEQPGEALLEPEGVKVEVDKIVRPGAVVSGSVVFSDGVRCEWQLDQMGQLGLIPSQEGYQPSREDIEDFQRELREELQKSGF